MQYLALVSSVWLAACVVSPDGGLPAPTPDAAPAGWQEQAHAAIAAGEYAPTPAGAGFRVHNRAQRMRGAFQADGLAVTDRGGGGEVTLSLRAWGREDGLESAGRVAPELGDCLAGGAVDPYGVCLPRVEFVRPGLVEWWENRPDGLEHGFTVTAPPAGEGALVLELQITGAAVEVDGDGVILARDGGEPLHYTGLVAWDETGRSLPAWFEESDGIRIVVDDGGAIGTITVDPLLTTAAWTANGGQAEASLGSSVASAGDVNGDGYGDVVVGAPGYDNGEAAEGRAYLYLGSAAGLAPTAAWTAESNQDGAAFGAAVASAGDVDGDGYGDVVVGASGYDAGSTDEGRAYVYLGSAGGLATTAAWTAESDQDSAGFGASVAAAGDVNGDGYGDVVVGASAYDDGSTDEGRAYVYLGSAAGLATAAAWTASSDQDAARFGASVASAGDVDGDGFGDLVVGADGYDAGSTDEGRAYVYLGSAAGLATTAAWTAESDQDSAGFGGSVASAGDVNGDGYGDVVVGASAYDNGSTDEGAAFQYLGSAAGLSTTAAWTVESDQASAGFGASVATAGDVNGDGFGDIVVGAPGFDNGSTDEGRAYVYLGSASGTAAAAAWTVESDEAYARYGASVACAGDVNGDGVGDVVVGAPDQDGGAADAGRTSVHLGSPSGLAVTNEWTAAAGAVTYFGWSVASAGDVNGDGYGDVIIGAFDKAFVFHGSSSGLTTTPSWEQAGAAYSSFGMSVASAGDVNGDGYGDVVVGTAFYDNGEDNEGGAWMYLGSSSGLATSASWTVELDQAGTYFGWQVASAGDVNGDGYGDVVVGAPGDDSAGADAGRVHVYLGSTSGLATSAAWIAESGGAGAWFGYSVASAGDVNGDGYSDLIVGLPYRESAVLYLGSSSGLATTEAWTGLSGQAGAVYGAAVASAGDVNGDGYSDVAIGAPGYTHGTSGEGRAYVYLGSAAGLGTSHSWSIESDMFRAAYGFSIASAGDVNGDGFGDVVVGAPNYAYGSAYLYLGSSSGLASSAAWNEGADWAGAQYGWAAASAGDVNGDGYGDVMAGCGDYYASNAYLYLGNGADGTTPLARAAQARQPGGTTPIAAGFGSASGSAFDVAMIKARGSWGSGKVRMQVEVKPLGTPFDGTDLLTQDDVTSSGLEGAEIQQQVGDLTAGTGHHWRARVLASPAEGRPQGWGTWMYGGLPGNPNGSHVFTLGGYYPDVDGDGFGDSASPSPSRAAAAGYVADATDCDDSSASIHPGATEVCDAADVDEDCNGLADNADPAPTGTVPTYADVDGDGHGGPEAGTACDILSGYLPTSTDCDDHDPTVHPDADEGVGDEHDSDCDGAELCLLDADDDGYVDGTGATLLSADLDCTDAREAKATALAGDCDDTDAAWHPGASEPDCGDPNDYNCDGSAGAVDGDGDGYVACADCDDGDAAVNPASEEAAGDRVDGDCDGVELCFVDADGDGSRPDATSVVSTTNVACDGDGEAVASAPTADCDDTNATVDAGAEELVGDEVDEDCDGGELCHVDADGDGFRPDATSSVPSPDVACDATGEATSTTPTGDCDDTDAVVNPGATEIAGDDVDGDCDGVELCFVDADDDGYRSDETSIVASADGSCVGPGEATSSAPVGDCDDTDPLTNSGATEIVGDGVDEDCDGVELCYVDADGDGYLADEGARAPSDDADCADVGEGSMLALAGDCDDDDDAYNPGAAEEDCTDPNDYNCDGSVGYADADGDGYAACLDCDDSNPEVHPDAPELPADLVDGDCDGTEDCYADSDGDGVRPDATSTVLSTDMACDGVGEATSTASTGDCDDEDPLAYPGAPEIVGDEVDEDCDGGELCHVDADGDGWRPDDTSTVASEDRACDGAGESSAEELAGDCDDTDPARSPATTEIVGDGVDQDCDGLELCFVDADWDGYRADDADTSLSTNWDCATWALANADTPAGDCDDSDADYNPGVVEDDCTDPHDYNCDGSVEYADADGDGYAACLECDDSTAAVNPASEERCNGIDDNCDGLIDAGATDAETWLADADGDGYTDPEVTEVACEPSEGFAAASSEADCDDADDAVFPGAAEIPDDGIDQDCDGADEIGIEADDTGKDDPDEGCGCSSTGGTTGWVAGLVVVALSVGRRRPRC